MRQNIDVNLRQKQPKRFQIIDGDYYVDGERVTAEAAILVLSEAVQELGYWCQVAKDVLPVEMFDEVQFVYEAEE